MNIYDKIKYAIKNKKWYEVISLCLKAKNNINTKNIEILYTIDISYALALVKTYNDCRENLDKAIDIYYNLLRIIDKDSMSDKWASIQRNLGLVYSKKNNKNKVILKSIEHYINATEVITKSKNPVMWASIMTEIGFLYSKLKSPEKKDYVNDAIFYFKEAKKVFTKEDYPADWKILIRSLKKLEN